MIASTRAAGFPESTAPPASITLTFEDGTTAELECSGELIEWIRKAARHGGFEVY